MKNYFCEKIHTKLAWKSFIVNTIKYTVPRTYIINDLNREEIIGTFFEKEQQKTNQKEFGIEKVIKRKGDKLLNVKVIIIHLIAEIIKKI